MYRNDISEEYQKNSNLNNEEVFDFYCKKEEDFIKSLKVYEVSYRIMLWLKYYRLEVISFDTCINSFLGDYSYTLNDSVWEELQNRIEIMLYDKFHIKVIKKDPMILESTVPFDKIKEEF